MLASNSEPSDLARGEQGSDTAQTVPDNAESMDSLGCAILFIVVGFLVAIGGMILNLFSDFTLFGQPAYRVLALPALVLFVLLLILFYIYGRKAEKDDARQKDMRLALTRVRQENTRFVSPGHLKYIQDNIFQTCLTEGKRFTDALEILTLLEEKARATGLEVARMRVEEMRLMADKVTAKYVVFRDHATRFLQRDNLRYSTISFFQKELEGKIRHLVEAENKLASMVSAVDDTIDRILRRQDKAVAFSEFAASAEEQNAVWLRQMEENMERMQSDLE